MESSDKEQEKKKINEIKTFAVPFSLDEIKENISITTIPTSKHSKEEIINQAFRLQLKGNLSEAAKYYQYCIKKGFNDPIVFANYGGILKGFGKSKEAELYTRKAIELKPDLTNAHLNLGNILRDLGKLKEAELSTRKAIELEHDYAEAHSSLANILEELGRREEAIKNWEKAVKLKPDNETAMISLSLHLCFEKNIN